MSIDTLRKLGKVQQSIRSTINLLEEIRIDPDDAPFHTFNALAETLTTADRQADVLECDLHNHASLQPFDMEGT